MSISPKADESSGTLKPEPLTVPKHSLNRATRVALLVFPIVALAVAVPIVVAVVERGASPDQTVITSPQVEIVAVARQDLATTASFPGVLSRGTPQVLKGTSPGTVTKLPAVGTVLDRGAEVYRVDERPVFAFFGDTPLYRPLVPTGPDTPDLIGADVAMVAANLAALGFAPEGEFSDPAKAAWDWELRAALMEWQESSGLERTGTLSPGDIAVFKESMMVSSVTASIGDTATGPLLSVTGTTKIVTVPLTVEQAGPVEPMGPVVIVRPDGREVDGTVLSIGTVLTSPGEDSDPNEPPKLTLVVTPSAPEEIADLDYSAVKVRIVSETRTGILVVPVEALIALREGGYALQLEDGSYRPVTAGMFTEALVEVSGEGITEGLVVVTAS